MAEANGSGATGSSDHRNGDVDAQLFRRQHGSRHWSASAGGSRRAAVACGRMFRQPFCSLSTGGRVSVEEGPVICKRWRPAAAQAYQGRLPSLPQPNFTVGVGHARSVSGCYPNDIPAFVWRTAQVTDQRPVPQIRRIPAERLQGSVEVLLPCSPHSYGIFTVMAWRFVEW